MSSSLLVPETQWVSKSVAFAKAQGIMPQHPVAFIINASEILRQVAALKAAFPPSALHAFACKANPLSAVLKLLSDHGMACETASLGEYTTAKRHFGADKVVFDSPVKTMEELEVCCRDPCFVNLDNFQELERVASIYQANPTEFRATVGLRINPQIGAGSIDALSTGRATSKFGIGLEDCRKQLEDAYRQHKWLTMVHVHTGSQGLPVDLMVASIKKIFEFTRGLPDHVKTLDIGGGLSVNFKSDEYLPGFEHYAEHLKRVVPELFDAASPYRIVTEMGRTIVAKAGIYLSRVEYTKVNGGRRIVSQHCGHDLLLRTVWAPNDWPLRVHIYDGVTGALRTEDVGPTDVAGPCCLGGDLACKERPLPLAQPNDVVAIRDVGGYYHVSYNYYNLRPAPPVYFYSDESPTLKCIHRGRTIEETLAFFQCDE